MSQALSDRAEKDPEGLLSRVEQGQGLPPIRPVTRELIALFWREGSTARELEAILAADNGLGEMIVGASNRKYFQALFKAATPRQAIARAGFRLCAKFALSIALTEDLSPLLPDAADRTDYIQRALCRAVTAETLEDYLRCKAREEAFVLGFAWDVGFLLWRPLLGQAHGGACPLDLTSLDECLSRERLHAGVDHLQLAAAALSHWGFPQRATACLACADEAGPDAVLLRSCCELADLVTRLLFSGFQDVPVLFELGKARLGTDADELGDVLLAAASELARVAETLVADVDLQRGLRDLLRKAERSIIAMSDRPGTPLKTGLPSFESLAPGSESEEFMEAVAHEVRNPLMAVAGFARKLMDTVNPASREGEYAQIILEEGQRLEAALARMQPGSRR